MSFIVRTILESFINAVFWGMGYALKNDMDCRRDGIELADADPALVNPSGTL